MKYIKYFVLFLVLFLSCNCFVNAETVDVNPPTISGVTLQQTNFTAGDTITLNFDANDDISGIFDIVITFIKVNETVFDGNNNITINLDPTGNGNWSGVIPAYIPEGEYQFYELFIEDNVRNEQWYTRYETFRNGIVTDFSLPDFYISKKEGDLRGPILTKFEISNLEPNPNEEVTITAEVEDENSVSSVIVYLSDGSHVLSKISDNVFQTTFSSRSPGIYKLSEIQLKDSLNNQSAYMYKEREQEMGYIGDSDRYFTIENGKYDITVLGEPDKEIPVLHKVLLPVKEVKAPTVFKVYIEASDDVAEFLGASISVKLDNCEGFCGNITTNFIGYEKGKYVFSVDINQYVEPGTYVINVISLYDDVGNNAIYTIGDISMPHERKLDRYTFEVVEDVKSDETTSSTSNDLLDKIDNAQDGANISINTVNNPIISKEVFEHIKGTNKTISLESNGIRWIFNGNDIIDSKEIDTTVEIHYVEKYHNKHKWNFAKNKALVIKFKDNGVLPGKALIKIKADYAFREYLGEKRLRLYYLNDDGFDLISKGLQVSKTGYYEFYIDHNSEYYLTSGEVEKENLRSDYTEKLGNNDLNEEVVLEPPKEDTSEEVIEEDTSKETTEEKDSKDDNNKDKIKQENNNIKNIVLYGIIIFVVISVIILIIIILRKKLIKKKQ